MTNQVTVTTITAQAQHATVAFNENARLSVAEISDKILETSASDTDAILKLFELLLNHQDLNYFHHIFTVNVNSLTVFTANFADETPEPYIMFRGRGSVGSLKTVVQGYLTFKERCSWDVLDFISGEMPLAVRCDWG